MSTDKITLYDFPTTLESKVVSPWTTRIRVALTVKKIPFMSVWVPFKDVLETMKNLGAEPTEKLSNGRFLYTVPTITIERPGEQTIILSDSQRIARYLDEKYPEPQLFRKETGVLDSIAEAYINDVTKKIRRAFMIHANAAWGDESAAYFARSRMEFYGIPIEKVIPQTDDDIAQAKVELFAGLDALAAHLDKAGEGNHRLTPYVSYPEVTLVALLHNLKAVSEHTKAGLEHAGDWKRIELANGGRWARLLDEPEYRKLPLI